MEIPYMGGMLRISSLLMLLLLLSILTFHSEMGESSSSMKTTLDRFEGVYFSLDIEDGIEDAIDAIAEQADRVFGFGWIRNITKTKVIGEFRGDKNVAAPVFLSFLREIPSSSLKIHKYKDTRIRYHFTDFRRIADDDDRFPIREDEL